MSCINCQWSERIKGRNEMVGCNYDKSLHNAEDCCINYLPITIKPGSAAKELIRTVYTMSTEQSKE